MRIILCIDDNNGISFHHRRQSQDRALVSRLLSLAGGHRLWMNSRSKRQFPDPCPANLLVDEAYLEKAGPTDYCFVEDQDIAPYAHQMDRLILFKWNRSYPADVYLTLDLSSWRLVETEDFPGYSHERITEEVFVR